MKFTAPVNIACNAARRGFTMTELIVVVAIVAILSAGMIGGYANMEKSQRLSTTMDRVVSSLYLARSHAIGSNLVTDFTIVVENTGVKPVQFIGVRESITTGFTARLVSADAANPITISSPGPSIDGVDMQQDDYILLTAQTSPIQNGLWMFDTATTPLLRPQNYASGTTLPAPTGTYPGMLVSISEGGVYEQSIWLCANAAKIDSDATTWTRNIPGLQFTQHTLDWIPLPREIRVTSGGDVRAAVAASDTPKNIVVASPGTLMLDGITINTGDRVLLTFQTNANENGIWVYNGTNAMVRPLDYPHTGTVSPLLSVYVHEGTANADTIWQCSTPGMQIDTNPTTWGQNVTNFEIPFNTDGTADIPQKQRITLVGVGGIRAVDVFQGGMIKIVKEGK